MNENINNTEERVALNKFSKVTECHFTTASRLRSGDRMPGPELLLKIVKKYNLDPMKTLEAFGTKNPAVFGRFLRENVFHITEEDLANDKNGSGSHSSRAA
jgi:hypothetical protein